MTHDERLAHDYATTVVAYPEHSDPEVVETVEIEGERVAIVRYATMKTPATATDAPVFGRADDFTAIPADAKVHPLSVSRYENRGQHHQAGDLASVRGVATVNGRDYARCATVKATIKAARERIERDRLFAQYAPVAAANVGSHTREQFEALDADAEIEPGDLVVVLSHSKYRTGVAIKTTRTRVDCLASTPTGGVANGATRTKGTQVRLLSKATPAAAVPAAAAGDFRAVGEAIQARAERAEAAEQPGEDQRQFLAGLSDEQLRSRVRSYSPGSPAANPAKAAAAQAELDQRAESQGRGEASEEGPESRDCVRVYVRRNDNGGRQQWCATHRLYEPIPDTDDGPAVPVLDETEDRQAVAGRVFASMQGMGDAGAGCTLYRMLAGRVGARHLRIHDAAGEPLGAVQEVEGEGFVAYVPAGQGNPIPPGVLGSFAEAVAAVRTGAVAPVDDQGATVAAREGESMGETETPAGADPVAGGAAAELYRLVLLGRSTHLEIRPEMPLRQYATLAEMEAALTRPGAAAALRAIADQVERDQAGHVTDILEPDGAGQYAWRCVQGDAEGTGYEVGEDAYKAATAHGPLVATSLFARGPVIEHEGRGDNEHGVPRRMLAGSLQWEPYDGGEWRLAGRGTTSEIGEGDIAGAHAWAAGLMGADDYDRLGVRVLGWELHRDAHGEWWEPVTR